MIKLFAPVHTIDIHHNFDHLLHGSIVTDLEKAVADYVGAKYAVAVSSATAGIFLSLKHAVPSEEEIIQIPSIIPPVVPNVLINSDIKFGWNGNTYWVGSDYTLLVNRKLTMVDSAQSFEPGQFKNWTSLTDTETLMIFSFYPTKPLGGFDGGMVVSDNEQLIEWIRTASRNGTKGSENSWDRSLIFPGWKMYMNSIQAKYLYNKLTTTYEQERAKVIEIREVYNEAFGINNISNHLYRVAVNEHYTPPNDIQTGRHYAPCHLNPVYKGIPCRFSNEKDILEQSNKVSIPLHSGLSEAEVKYIIHYFKKYVVCET